MTRLTESVVQALVAGLLVVMPLYLSLLLLLKIVGSLKGLVQPVAQLLPDWLPRENLVALLLVLVTCVLIGAAVRTRVGRTVRERLEKSFFERIPAYSVFKSLTYQVMGEGQESSWKPALVEIEEALVPAFIIEEHEDGRFTVFIPSVPAPLAGAIYILTPERVHPLDVPFTQAVRAVSRWGAGSKALVAAMDRSRSSAI